MITLKDYVYIKSLDEGFIGDLLKDFWEWLIGKNNKDEYDIGSSSYDEVEKKKYINKFTSNAIKTKLIQDEKILSKILERSTTDDDEKNGFYKTIELLKGHSKYGKITYDNKWLSFIFKSSELTEACGLIAFTTNDPTYKDSTVIYFSEFLPEYAGIINYGDILNELKTLGDTVIITDKDLIKTFDKEDLDVIHINKNVCKL